MTSQVNGLSLKEFLDMKHILIVCTACQRIVGTTFPVNHWCNEQLKDELHGFTTHEDTKANRKKLWKLGVRP